jgi:fumarylacetoacetase
MHRRLTPHVERERSLFVGKQRNLSEPAFIPLPSQADNLLQGRHSNHEAKSEPGYYVGHSLGSMRCRIRSRRVAIKQRALIASSFTDHHSEAEQSTFEPQHLSIIMASLRSWFSIPRGSHFSLANIPFGIVSTASSSSPRVAVAIGDHALDLEAFAANNGFSGLSTIQPHQAVFSQSSLNEFAALGRPIHSVVRKYIQTVFSEDTTYPDVLKNNAALQEQVLIPLKEIKSHMPFTIGDYTDFYAGMNHAYNCGVIFRGPDNALPLNYKHLPIGYHGRASSVVPSGTPIRRPNGQFLLHPTSEFKVPMFGPCKKLDIELELGAFVCGSNEQGVPIPIKEAEENLFGVVLMNDWSARDIQAWECVPLGPFNSKNFGTTISTWVVLADALEPFKTEGLKSDGPVLDYLNEKDDKTVYDINLQINLKSKLFVRFRKIQANNPQHHPEAQP